MTTTTSRLDLRLDAHDKRRITKAAALRGLPVSAFVRQVVLREADNAMYRAKSQSLGVCVFQ